MINSTPLTRRIPLSGIRAMIVFHGCVIVSLILCDPAFGQTIGPSPGYQQIAAHVQSAIEYERQDKDLQAISVGIVDDQQIVWAQGFGAANPDSGVPASADTVYRVGSVSKLFTDIGMMQLVEQGELNLDAPVRHYLPEFQPENPFQRPITLRQLTSHRSGLVREPPVGNYFDDAAPSLADTVSSLNRTRLVFAPETEPKYSNAGIAVVGRVLEKVTGKPFAECLRSEVLEPMGLTTSAFEPTPEILRNLAVGRIWSYDGRAFQAPPIQPLDLAARRTFRRTCRIYGRHRCGGHYRGRRGDLS